MPSVFLLLTKMSAGPGSALFSLNVNLPDLTAAALHVSKNPFQSASNAARREGGWLLKMPVNGKIARQRIIT